LTALDQARNRVEYQAMIVAIEIFGDHTIGDLIPGRRVEHEAAEHRLLGLDRMRRQAQPVAGATR
jgi:hypothetical protein